MVISGCDRETETRGNAQKRGPLATCVHHSCLCSFFGAIKVSWRNSLSAPKSSRIPGLLIGRLSAWLVLTGAFGVVHFHRRHSRKPGRESLGCLASQSLVLPSLQVRSDTNGAAIPRVS